jgi:hypothetical protein
MHLQHCFWYLRPQGCARQRPGSQLLRKENDVSMSVCGCLLQQKMDALNGTLVILLCFLELVPDQGSVNKLLQCLLPSSPSQFVITR